MRPHSLLMAISLLATDVATLHAQQLAGGIHVGGPVKAPLALGAMWLGPTSDRTHGPVVLAEPGLRGHRISAGYLVARGNLGKFASLRATGLALREDDAWRRYAGLDLQLQPAFATGVRVSALVPVGPTGPRGLRWIVDVALGL